MTTTNSTESAEILDLIQGKQDLCLEDFYEKQHSLNLDAINAANEKFAQSTAIIESVLALSPDDANAENFLAPHRTVVTAIWAALELFRSGQMAIDSIVFDSPKPVAG